MTDVICYKGRTSNHKFQWKDYNGNVIDISTFKLKFSVKGNASDEDPPLFELMNEAGGGSDITFFSDGTDGIFIVTIPYDDIDELDEKVYNWEIIYATAIGDPQYMGSGRFVILPSIATPFS